MEIKTVKASGNFVILEVKIQELKQEEKKLDSGIILPASVNKQKKNGQDVQIEGQRQTVAIYVYDIGPGVDLGKNIFRKGDEVFVNNYDLQTFGDDTDKLFAVCDASSIKAVIEADR